MKKSNFLPLLVIILSLSSFIIWGFAIWGMINRQPKSTGNSSYVDNSQTPSTQSTEPVAIETPTEVPTQAPTQVATNPPTTELMPEEVAGNWDISYRRYYSTKNNTEWEVIGLEEVNFWIEIFSGNYFEYNLMPTDYYINGEQDNQNLPAEPKLYTGELNSNTLLLYLDMDDFYLNFDAIVTDTIAPSYVELPLSVQNGKLVGSYNYTWETTLDGVEMQYQVSFEAVQR